MPRERRFPDDPIRFIQGCVRQGRLLLTYHVTMRLAGRFILREAYLVLGRAGTDAFHVVFATDVEGDNVRVVTAYRPDSAEWHDDLKTRRRDE